MTDDATRTLTEGASPNGNGAVEKNDKLAIIAWGGDLDRIWPTLILSTTAAASGMESVVFFTFWGLFALVRDGVRITGETWMQKMLSVVNPGGPGKAKLSKWNLAGAGPWMMKSLAKDYKTPNPKELLALAQEMGVRLIPCQMTMDLLGLTKSDLIDGLEEPVGAATALLEMRDASVQLFI
jgi:peroxiredoxin family protein